MSRGLNMVVMFGVLVHMVFGCCLHHAHALNAHGSDPFDCRHACTCDHGGHEDHGCPGDQRQPHQGCDGDRCWFTRAESSDTMDFCAALQGVPAVTAAFCRPTPCGIGLMCPGPARPVKPVPLHLLNQVLLL